MTRNLPGPVGPQPPSKERRAELKQQAKAPAVRTTKVEYDAAGVAQMADVHIQKWREGMARLMLEMTMDEGWDALRAKLNRSPGFQILKEATLESPRVMAALRPFWDPNSKVEIRD